MAAFTEDPGDLIEPDFRPRGYGIGPDSLAPATAEGLDDFDVDRHAQHVADISDATEAALALPGDKPLEPQPGQDTQQGALGAEGPHTPIEAGSNPAPATPGGVDVTTFAPVPAGGTPPQFPELGPPPTHPEPTGDPQKDVAANLKWQQDIAAHTAELHKRQNALAEYAANVGAMKGKKEAEVAAVNEAKVAAENQRYEAERLQRQQAITSAISERAAAYKDLESAKWDKPHTGGQIFALLVGGLGAAMQNAGAALIGHQGNAQNEAMKVINAKMDKEFAAKKMKLEAAGDALLAAKYGYKDAADNHRAAMNDLNAETAAKYKLIGTEAASILAGQGATKAQIDGNLIVADAAMKQAQHEGDIANREEGHAASRQASEATLNLAKANLGERTSEHIENLGERKSEFALRRADAAEARADRAAAAADREAAKKAAADEKKAKADATLAVRDANGVVVGGAPSARVVKPLQDRLIQYDDAIKSVEDLIAYNKAHPLLGAFPMGDRYDRAVLAVAATTQANASDATTKHESGTLKQYGMLTTDAAKRTLEHLKKRQAAFLKQLTPIGGERPKAETPAEGGAPKSFPAPGGGQYEMGADGNYHLVK